MLAMTTKVRAQALPPPYDRQSRLATSVRFGPDTESVPGDEPLKNYKSQYVTGPLIGLCKLISHSCSDA